MKGGGGKRGRGKEGEVRRGGEGFFDEVEELGAGGV